MGRAFQRVARRPVQRPENLVADDVLVAGQEAGRHRLEADPPIGLAERARLEVGDVNVGMDVLPGGERVTVRRGVRGGEEEHASGLQQGRDLPHRAQRPRDVLHDLDRGHDVELPACSRSWFSSSSSRPCSRAQSAPHPWSYP